MKTWHMMVIYVVANVLFWGGLFWLGIQGFKAIDNHGGIKALVERAWEGKK